MSSSCSKTPEPAQQTHRSSSSCSQTPEPAQQTHRSSSSCSQTPEPAQQTHRSSTTQQTPQPQILHNKLTCSSSSCSQPSADSPTPEPAQQTHRFIILLFSALSRPSDPRTCTTNSQVHHPPLVLRPQNLHNKLTGSSSSCSQPSADPPTLEPAQQTHRFIILLLFSDPRTCTTNSQVHHHPVLSPQQTLQPQNLHNKLTGHPQLRDPPTPEPAQQTHRFIILLFSALSGPSDPRTCTTNSQVIHNSADPPTLEPAQQAHRFIILLFSALSKPSDPRTCTTNSQVHHPPVVLRPQNLHNKLTGHPQLSRPSDPRSCTTNSHVHHHPVFCPQQTLRPQNLHNKLTCSSSSCSQP